MAGEVLRCQCGRIVGTRSGGAVSIKWRGRRVIIQDAAQITIVCEKCKKETKIFVQKSKLPIDNTRRA